MDNMLIKIFTTIITIIIITLVIVGFIKLYARDKKHDAVLTWKIAAYIAVICTTTYQMIENFTDNDTVIVNMPVIIVSVIELISNIIEFNKDYNKKNKK